MMVKIEMGCNCVCQKVMTAGAYKLAAACSVVTAAALSLMSATVAYALPFNDDMVNINKSGRTGVMMREKVPNTVPLGSLPTRLTTKQDAETLVNPLKGDVESVKRGKRLWAVNCFPCHGDISKVPYVPGYVAAKLPLLPPDPTADMYKSKTDGFFYGVVHLGAQGIMPVLGWKFSETEHWDIANYIRAMQNTVRETRK